MGIKISVIIPVYNVENYLEKCLDSIVNQTFKDMEIICINDGSTDNSLSILEKYAKLDNRITIYNQENQGVAKTRNYGIQLAKGEYLYFIDSDDYIDYDFLEKLYNVAKTNNYDYVGGNLKILDDNGQITNDDKFCSAWYATIYKKEVVKKYDIDFPDSNAYEDMAFYYKFQAVAESSNIVNNTFYYYVYNNNSITRQNYSHKARKEKIKKAVFSRMNVLYFIEKFIKNDEKYLKFFELNFERLKYTLEKNFYEREMYPQLSEELSKFRYATDFSKHKKHPVFEYFINKEYDKFIQSINITKHYDKEASIQILKQLDETQKQPVMFWGASVFLKLFLEHHSIKNYNIIGIIDNNPDLWGKKYEGLNVFSPKYLTEIKPRYIIFTIKNNSKVVYNNILKTKQDLNLPETYLCPCAFKGIE